MFAATSQLYNLFWTIPLCQRAKRKKYFYFELIQYMQATDHLTSLVIAYGRLTDQLEYYSYDIGRQDLIQRSLQALEQKIKSEVMNARRHSF